MAIIYYPSGSTVYTRQTTINGMVEQFIGVSPDQILVFSSSAIAQPAYTSASYALVAGSLSVVALYVASNKYTITGSYMNFLSSSYTMSANDNGLLLSVSSSTDSIMYITSSLPYGFNCTMYQSGSGRICVTGSNSSTIIRNRWNYTGSSGQYAVMSLMRIQSGDFVLTGDTG